MKLSDLKKLKRDQIVLIGALIVALIVVILYYLSGQKSYDQNTRDLKNSDPKVQEITTTEGQIGEKDMQVKCKDGSSYDVYYPPGEKDYSSLSASKCQDDQTSDQSSADQPDAASPDAPATTSDPSQPTSLDSTTPDPTQPAALPQP